MNKNEKGILRVYFMAAALNLAAQLSGIYEVTLTTKPFLMISLAYFAWLRLRGPNPLAHWICVALMFSWVGDILLIFDKDIPLLFVVGLGAFALAHACYAFTFLVHGRNSAKRSKHLIWWLAFIGLLIIFMASGYFFVSVSGGLSVAVAVYCLLIAFMTLSALLRYGRTDARSFWLTLVGALLFMVSDSLIGFQKFVQPVDYGSFWVMISYILSQYVILMGVVAHQRSARPDLAS